MLSYNTPYIQESTVKSHNHAPENQLMYKKLPKSPKQENQYLEQNEFFLCYKM